MFEQIEMKAKNDINAQGYTLIEVLIAVAVFAVGILAVFSMQISATSGNALARGLTENYTAATVVAEQLLALPYNNANLDPANSPFTPAQSADGIDNDGDGLIDEGGETGHLTVSWQVWENRLWGQNILSVRVTVTSSINRGDQRAVNIDFFKANW
jgi:type IV pilus assembly protein PilV